MGVLSRAAPAAFAIAAALTATPAQLLDGLDAAARPAARPDDYRLI